MNCPDSSNWDKLNAFCMSVVLKQQYKYKVFISFPCNLIVKTDKSSLYSFCISCSVPLVEWNRWNNRDRLCFPESGPITLFRVDFLVPSVPLVPHREWNGTEQGRWFGPMITSVAQPLKKKAVIRKTLPGRPPRDLRLCLSVPSSPSSQSGSPTHLRAVKGKAVTVSGRKFVRSREMQDASLMLFDGPNKKMKILDFFSPKQPSGKPVRRRFAGRRCGPVRCCRCGCA